MVRYSIIYTLLYFSEGAPIGFIWWALPGILREQGFLVEKITIMTSLIALPWSLKFIIAPIADIALNRGFPLRKILFFVQLLMALFLMIFSRVEIPKNNLNLILPFLLCHSVAASFQDVIIDALVIRTIPKKSLGRINGLMQTGMLVGRSLFGGAGIYFTHLFGLSNLVLALSITIALLALITFWIPRHAGFEIANKISLKKYLFDMSRLFASRNFALIITVAFFAGFAFEGIGALTSPVFVEKGISVKLRSLFYGFISPLSLALGAIWGGWMVDRTSPKRVLKWVLPATFGVAVCLSSFFETTTNEATWLLLPASVLYLFIGAHTSSLYAYLMERTPHRFAALGFSLAMAMTNLCETASAYFTGKFQAGFGYFFSITGMALFFLPAWFVVLFFKVKTHPSASEYSIRESSK